MRKIEVVLSDERLITPSGLCMLIAGHLTVHARKVLLALGRSSPWANTFLRIWHVLSEG